VDELDRDLIFGFSTCWLPLMFFGMGLLGSGILGDKGEDNVGERSHWLIP